MLDNLIADMLAKDPQHRPQTMGAVQRALRAAMAGPATEARPSDAPPAPTRPSTIPEAPPRPVLSVASAEISIVGPPLSPGAQNERPAAPVAPMVEGGAMSGELLVPASRATPAAPPAPAPAPARRETALFGLCLLLLAALAAIAVATIA